LAFLLLYFFCGVVRRRCRFDVVQRDELLVDFDSQRRRARFVRYGLSLCAQSYASLLLAFSQGRVAPEVMETLPSLLCVCGWFWCLLDVRIGELWCWNVASVG